MDYTAMVNAVKKYIKKRYSYQIINKLKNGRPFIAERKELIKDALPGIDKEILELLLEQMHVEGYVIKDDGHTVTFSEGFVFN